MAYLNVRERRIEATIAYVGPELAGKATNFDHLRSAPPSERLGKLVGLDTGSIDRLALAWQPVATGRFRDCEVFVKLVAQRGRVSAEHTDDVLKDADGVVIVMDADPTADAKNRASLEAVRQLLARGGRRDVPVVLQVNKSDLPDARGADEVIGKLEAKGLRHVVASARSGEGVVETLEAALEEVLMAMQSPSGQDEGGGRSVIPASRASGTPGDGGHPLLAALRQVLRETVLEHAEEVEARVMRGVERSFERLDGSVSRVEQRLLAADAAWMDLRDQVTAINGRVERLREEVKADAVRTLETRGRADREHLATATVALKKSIDALAPELRALEARSGELALHVEATEQALAAVTPRLEQIEMAAKQQSTRTDAALRTFRADVSDGLAATEQKVTGVHASVNEIVEELKKPKKSWFT